MTGGRKKRIGRDVDGFLRQYGRRKHAGHDPNDRPYDRGLEAELKRLPPEELDRLIRGEEEWDTLVEGVCLLVRPGAFSRHASIENRLRSTGYKARPEDLTSEVLADYLADHPELVDDWLRYSEDKRTSSGWYFRRLGDGRTEVGWFPDGEVTAFDDPLQGCAAFIEREVRALSAGGP